MTTVTPITQGIRYSGQDDDERGAVFAELQSNPAAYLSHADAQVRSAADWTLEYFGIRRLRPDLPERDRFPADTARAHGALLKLYHRLRELA